MQLECSCTRVEGEGGGDGGWRGAAADAVFGLAETAHSGDELDCTCVQKSGSGSGSGSGSQLGSGYGQD